MHACYALYTLRKCETLPAPDLLSSIFPAPSLSAQWEAWTLPKPKCEKDQDHGEKRLRTSEFTRDPQPPKEGELTTPQCQDVVEGKIYEVRKIVTTTGDVDVVEEESHFTSASAHVVIGEIVMCNCDLQKIKEGINVVE
ncbi:hypothetical protein AB205_0096330 [Aquarana catesbeiana]|uniref:Uncharacterized protein n=1 Tax=Aquarana catesbeiana TaxID=8400 RepID=A0A2G9RE72_AQUCT|nr:hypothetical protein AB205_0096330 [Aquarana catesbeiana]